MGRRHFQIGFYQLELSVVGLGKEVVQYWECGSAGQR